MSLLPSQYISSNCYISFRCLISFSSYTLSLSLVILSLSSSTEYLPQQLYLFLLLFCLFCHLQNLFLQLIYILLLLFCSLAIYIISFSSYVLYLCTVFFSGALKYSANMSHAQRHCSHKTLPLCDICLSRCFCCNV
jgi:hypothetical protein